MRVHSAQLFNVDKVEEEQLHFNWRVFTKLLNNSETASSVRDMSRCKPTQPLLFSVFCISLSLPHFFCISLTFPYFVFIFLPLPYFFCISLTLPYFVFISLPLPYFSALPCCCFFFQEGVHIVLWWNSKKQNYPKYFMFYFRKTIFCIIMLVIPLWTWFSALCMIMLQYLDVYIIIQQCLFPKLIDNSNYIQDSIG